MAELNHFEHFGIPVSFKLDTGILKKLYLLKSREFHPDFYTLHDDLTQDEMLQRSSYNNLAYNILKDEMKRLKYVLELNKMLGGENDNTLPQEFLMEMMDINEELMDLSMDYSIEKENTLRQTIDDAENSLKEEIIPLLESYDHNHPNQEDLENIKDFYFKSRYLWRLRENLDKFASQ